VLTTGSIEDMEILRREEFYAAKNSNTAVVYGSGYSIRKITPQEQEQLNTFDSFAFNWFLKSKIPAKFYFVREQANNSKRVDERQGEDVESFVADINAPPYDQSILVVHDLSGHSRRIFHYHRNLHRFKHKGVLVKDVKLKDNETNVRRWQKRNALKTGLYHGSITLNNVLHLVVNMKYNRIIFVGVDLYNSKYFWLRKRETRHTVRQKHQKYRSQHATAIHALGLVSDIKKYHAQIRLCVHNPKSLLTKIMKVWER